MIDLSTTMRAARSVERSLLASRCRCIRSGGRVRIVATTTSLTPHRDQRAGTGITTQREDLRNRLVVDSAADGLRNYFEATVEVMKVMARACGHDSLSGFERRNLSTWGKDIGKLTGLAYAGVSDLGA